MRAYVLKRLLWMAVTLFFVSILVFVIVQLPPGDYTTTYIARLSAAGQTVNEETILALRAQFGLDKPMYMQYLLWMRGFFTGNFGFSFEWRAPVAALIGDRLILTLVLTVVTMVFTWIVAFAIGLYSSTHQYSIGDYLATFLGFIGVSVPSFLLAMIMIWFLLTRFDVAVSGLFSREFVNAPWSLAKVLDLIQHMPLPVVILGLTGVASLLRTLRANMLDEITKPYVTAAKAKGVPARRLIYKYPLRIAMLPFISTIGWQVPNIINGQTMVGVILSLQILGPMLLNSLINQDMYLAGTILMFLSILTVVGTFVSDLLLAWADPRIRMS